MDRDEKGRFIKDGIVTEDDRRKLSLALMGNKNTLGYKHTKEAKIKMGDSRRGEKNCNWKGGRKKSMGYNTVLTVNGYIREHRLIMEEFFGRKLESWETVHHINGIKDDNRIENLMLLPKGEHNLQVQKVYQENEILKLRIKELELQLLA